MVPFRSRLTLFGRARRAFVYAIVSNSGEIRSAKTRIYDDSREESNFRELYLMILLARINCPFIEFLMPGRVEIYCASPFHSLNGNQWICDRSSYLFHGAS